MFQFDYLLERAKLGPEHMLVKDCLRIVSSGGDDIRKDRALICCIVLIVTKWIEKESIADCWSIAWHFDDMGGGMVVVVVVMKGRNIC